MATRAEQGSQRITLDLPNEALKKLDDIKREGRFESRNAVIEEMVDEVIAIKEILATAERETKSANFKDQSSVWALAYGLTNTIHEVSLRLAKFKGKAKG